MQILINGEWVDIIESDLKDGDTYRISVGQGGWQQQQYSSAIISNAIRIITKRAFMRRFAQTERIAIRKSIDDIVIDIYDDLKMSSNVDLDNQDTIDSINYLTSIGLITTSAVDLLKDGIETET